MNVDVTADEILEVCPFIVNCTEEYLNDFEEAVEQFENETDTLCKIYEPEDLIICSEDILQSQGYLLNGINDQVCKNKNYLEKIEQDTEKLESSQNDLLKVIAKNEDILEKIKAKISSIKKKKQNLAQIRDEILLCKLLTKTSFAFSGNSVEGFVVDQNAKHAQCFQLNPKEMSQSEIRNHLYGVLMKVSEEGKCTGGNDLPT